MRIVFILLLAGVFNRGFAQKRPDSIYVYEYPVKEGIIYNYDPDTFYGCWGGTSIVSIVTHRDSVFHFEEGKVVSVFTLDDRFVMVIRNIKGDVISYSNFKFVVLKKGDNVNRGMYIGEAANGDYDELNQVDVVIFKKKKELSYKKTIEYIQFKISSIRKEDYIL